MIKDKNVLVKCTCQITKEGDLPNPGRLFETALERGDCEILDEFETEDEARKVLKEYKSEIRQFKGFGSSKGWEIEAWAIWIYKADEDDVIVDDLGYIEANETWGYWTEKAQDRLESEAFEDIEEWSMMDELKYFDK